MEDVISGIDPESIFASIVWLLVLLGNVVLAYFFSLLVSITLKRIMVRKEIENFLVRYGAMTSKLWNSTTTFLTHYLKWYFTFMLTVIGFDVVVVRLLPTGIVSYKLSELLIVSRVFEFLSDLFWFIILTVSGLIVGGMLYKIVKEALEGLGLEDKLRQHRVQGAFGGIEFSSIIAQIAKWYVVLLFMNEGTIKLNLPVLAGFIGGLVEYIPNAISGFFIMSVSLLLARFTSERIRMRKLSFSEVFALGVECTIIFFGIVLSLPIFVEDLDVSILTDSFKIVVVGVSLGLAIALGLGLKDSFSNLSTRYTRE